jgi:3-oxoacyl-[acyl-carrier protein] reductase
VVVVSGGGTGIGRAVAGRFARHGETVIVIGRRADVLAESARRTNEEVGRDQAVTPLAADLADPVQAERVSTALRERHGRVDVLVNTAGGNVGRRPPDPPLTGLAAALWSWEGNFRSNVLTAVLLTEALRDLYAADARIILISSIAAFRGSGNGSYGAAKAALHPYAIDLATDLGATGGTVNVVAPGYVEETEFFGDQMTDQRRATLIGQTMVGRPGTVADVAEAVHWLASPLARHITGQIIQVNGGALPGR